MGWSRTSIASGREPVAGRGRDPTAIARPPRRRSSSKSAKGGADAEVCEPSTSRILLGRSNGWRHSTSESLPGEQNELHEPLGVWRDLVEFPLAMPARHGLGSARHSGQYGRPEACRAVAGNRRRLGFWAVLRMRSRSPGRGGQAALAAHDSVRAVAFLDRSRRTRAPAQCRGGDA